MFLWMSAVANIGMIVSHMPLCLAARIESLTMGPLSFEILCRPQEGRILLATLLFSLDVGSDSRISVARSTFDPRNMS